MNILKNASGKQTIKLSKKEWQNIGEKAGWSVLASSDENADKRNCTDKENSVGNWNGGWLNGEWKCPKCKTMIGKNLNGDIPFGLVNQHKCKEKES